VTPQRHAIFRVLTHATDHHTAEGVYAAVCTELPTISLRTVYQILNELSAMGELSALNLGTGSTRFDPNLEPHHHLVCEVCGRIDDLPDKFPGVLLPAPAAERFTVSSTEIIFRGRCTDCSRGPHPRAVCDSSKRPAVFDTALDPEQQDRSNEMSEGNASEEDQRD